MCERFSFFLGGGGLLCANVVRSMNNFFGTPDERMLIFFRFCKIISISLQFMCIIVWTFRAIKHFPAFAISGSRCDILFLSNNEEELNQTTSWFIGHLISKRFQRTRENEIKSYLFLNSDPNLMINYVLSLMYLNKNEELFIIFWFKIFTNTYLASINYESIYFWHYKIIVNIFKILKNSISF